MSPLAAAASAASNSARIFPSLSPKYLDTISGPTTIVGS